MITIPSPNVALYFDEDAYTETHRRAGSASGPAGLMGRQVAGKEFLDAYLSHTQTDTIRAVVRSRERAEPLVRICRDHPSSRERQRKLSIHVEADLLSGLPSPIDVLHFPCPPESRFAWLRQASGSRFALSGVTHTLSTSTATKALCDLVIAPFESFDALICTSRAVVDMVRAVTGAYSDYLADRFGGTPRLRPRLEVIPLGVNVDRFRPATASERATERARLGAAEDTIVILYVGRLSHHAKAHPFPLFHAVEQAAQRSGKKLLLVLSGWAAHPAIDQAFRDGAKRIAPSVPVHFADGLDPAVRTGVWRAADVFVSLPDNVQETFGLVVVEAMASGLPVVGSDWDGYRDLIVDDETGYLVPTQMVSGATVESTTRLLSGQSNYDQFLGECCQGVVVDPAAAANALTRLASDSALRQQLGSGGRDRAVRLFSWEKVVRAYEALWIEQAREVGVWESVAPRHPGPALYPAPEHSFAGYPSEWLIDSAQVRASASATESLAMFLEMPLTNFIADRRCVDRAVLTSLLNMAQQPCTMGALVLEIEHSGCSATVARATIAWLMKFGLLHQYHA